MDCDLHGLRGSVWYVPLWLRNQLGTFVVMDAALHAIADPSRRALLEALRETEATAGHLADLLPIARPGVSRHLRVLRDAGLVDVRQEGQHRVYSLHPEPLAEVDGWLEPYRALWRQRFDALHTEVARGKRSRGGTTRQEHER
jgi:DNA-binding transcriptional ArsR family regulator